MNSDRFKYKEITDIILRSFYEIYNELGDGFLESVYENALYIVLTGYGLCVERQKDLCKRSQVQRFRGSRFHSRP